MDCKIAEYWTNLYLDGQLDDECKIKLLDHINECPYCEKYFNRLLEIDNYTKELFEKSSLDPEKIKIGVMDEITSKNILLKKKSSKKKRKICAALLAGILLIVPINGKPAMAHVSEWVKSLIINKPGMRISIVNQDDKKEQSVSTVKGAEVKSKIKEFKTEEEVIKNVYEVENKPCLPEYLPERYIFKSASYEKYLGDVTSDFNIISYYERQEKNKTEQMTISVYYSKQGVNNCGYKKYISKNEKAKAINISGAEGTVIKNEEKNGLKIYSLDLIIDNYPVNIEISYEGYGKNKTIESEIHKVAENLIKEIKEVVPKNTKEDIGCMSKLFEGKNQEELYSKIKNIDDRIVELKCIPNGYDFKKGGFIDNPKEINAFSISSELLTIYEKNGSKLRIKIYYHTHTNKDCDFETYPFGEVEKKEKFLEYEMRIYKEDETRDGNISRVFSIGLPDYAMVINITSSGSQKEILSKTEIEKMMTSIIKEVKKQAQKRETIDFGNHIKVFSNIDEVRNDHEIKEKGLYVPSYIPQKFKFRRAKYKNNGYLLQLDEDSEDKMNSCISITMRKNDELILSNSDSIQKKDKIEILDYKGYMITEKTKYSEEVNEYITKLEIESAENNFVIAIFQIDYQKRNRTERELIKLAESILKQMK